MNSASRDKGHAGQTPALIFGSGTAGSVTGSCVSGGIEKNLAIW